MTSSSASFRPPNHRLSGFLEALEERIAPAGLVTYTDVDGDVVTIKSSKGSNAELAAILTFSSANENDPRQLQKIDFSLNAGVFADTTLSVTAKRGPNGGDGFVHVGEIDASAAGGGVGLDLGSVTIQGDLGRILAGDASTADGSLKSLSVQSLGRMGTTTGAGNLESSLAGSAGKIQVAEDILNARVFVTGGTDGRLGTLTVGGSILGLNGLASGSVNTDAGIGSVKIAGDLQGTSLSSGTIAAGGSLGSLAIGGSIIGGSGPFSGVVVAAGEIKKITIGQDLRGGGGEKSGRIEAGGGMASLTVGGSIFGQGGEASGTVSAEGAMKSLKIGGDLRGGAGERSGRIEVDGFLSSASLKGAIVGGTGTDSAQVQAFGGAGTIQVGGSLLGGSGTRSGEIEALGGLARLELTGNIQAQSASSARILTTGEVGSLKIGGEVKGAGTTSLQGESVGKISIGGSLTAGLIEVHDLDSLLIGGTIDGRNLPSGILAGISGAETGRGLGTVVVKGSVLGEAFANSGIIRSEGPIGSVQIGGNLQGGNSTESGRIRSDASIGSIFIGGSVFDSAGGSSLSAGTDLGKLTVGGDFAGRLEVSNGTLGAVSIGGNIDGLNSAGFSAVISAQQVNSLTVRGSILGGATEGSGLILVEETIGSVVIGGSVLGGAGERSGRLEAGGSMASVVIGGQLAGGAGEASGTIHTAGTLGKLTVGGSLAGGSGFASGQVVSELGLGSVTVKGNLEGGTGIGSGAIRSVSLTSLTISGSLLGLGPQSARVFISDSTGSPTIGTITIGGNVDGRLGSFGAGSLVLEGEVKSVKIAGSIFGGTGDRSGEVGGGSLLAQSLFVGGAVVGGSGEGSGTVLAEDATTLTVRGSVIGGSGDDSGGLRVNGTLTKGFVGGDLVGGSASGAANLSGSGQISGGTIEQLTLGGSLIAGTKATSGVFAGNGDIFAVDGIGALTIKGSVIGNATNAARIGVGSTLFADSQVLLGSLTVGKRVELATIVAGTFGESGDAQIGAVKVGGSWIASSLAAGVNAGGDGFGNANDTAQPNIFGDPSRIASIVIRGQVTGTATGGDHFGFVANEIGSVKIGNVQIPLLPGPANDDIALGTTGDVRILEI